MIYRVKKVTYINDSGEECVKFYPQYKFLWWHYYMEYDVFYGSSRNCFTDLEKAVDFIRLRIRQKREYSVDYIYLNIEFRRERV